MLWQAGRRNGSGRGMEGGMDGEEVQRVSCLAGSSLEASRAGLSRTRLSCHLTLGGTEGRHALQDPVPYHQLSCVWGRESHRSPHTVPTAKSPVQGTFSV